MTRNRIILNQLKAANPVRPGSAPPPARSESTYAAVMRAIREGEAEKYVESADSPAGWTGKSRRVRAAVVGIAVAILGVGLSLALLSGGLIGPEATAAAALRAVDMSGVKYFPDEQVFVVANGSEPVALSAIIPGDSKVPERVLYCPTSGWFEGPHGEMFDRLGNYALGPAESGLMRVAVELSGDQVIVDPSHTLGAPPRFVDDPTVPEPPPPLGPFCADPHVETQPGFVAPSSEPSALLGVWVDGAGNPVPGVWNSVDQTVISARDFLGTCDWDSVLFLEVGWPLGTVASTSETTRLFVRDPEGIFADTENDLFDAEAELPVDAVDTGFHRGDWELWTSQSVGDKGVFLVNGSIVEEWPLLPAAPEC
jgi:hypothetical protein